MKFYILSVISILINYGEFVSTQIDLYGQCGGKFSIQIYLLVSKNNLVPLYGQCGAKFNYIFSSF